MANRHSPFDIRNGNRQQTIDNRAVKIVQTPSSFNIMRIEKELGNNRNNNSKSDWHICFTAHWCSVFTQNCVSRSLMFYRSLFIFHCGFIISGKIHVSFNNGHHDKRIYILRKAPYPHHIAFPLYTCTDLYY